jgi:glyoxylase-like metal-dependent hydrolase (beta-lactamase superfamily II)
MEKIIDNVFIVKPYDPNVVDCCVYLVDTNSDDGLILIDAGINFEPIQEIEKEGYKLGDVRHCLITHGHLDHFGVCFKLKEFNENIKFYAHELDVARIEHKPTLPYPNPFYESYKYEPVKVTNVITEDNEVLRFGDLEIRCIHIPGHTPGSVAYLLEIGEKKIAFAGDIPGIAINIRDGDLDKYIKSMEKLLSLDIDIMCEGHEVISQPNEKVVRYIKGYKQFNLDLNFVVLENPYDIKALLRLASQSYELGWYSSVADFCNYLLEVDHENSDAKELLENIKKHNAPKVEYIKRLIKENFKGDNKEKKRIII